MLDQLWFLYFNLAIIVLLFFDLFVFHHKMHVVKFKEAILTSLFWIVLAMGFNVFIYYTRGEEDALKFLTGYLVEKALSVDNLFVFLLIFSYFRVPEYLLHKVLFWGVFGAIIMRAFFIVFGIALLEHFHGLIFIFGIFLIFTGYKLIGAKNVPLDLKSNFAINLFKRFFTVTPDFVGDKFFIRQGGRAIATPLFLVLLAVETTDLIFAIDSIPAIIGITSDPYIVYTSNIFAILGLRSLFFALSSSMSLFHYLHYGLAFILMFIGTKMLLMKIFPIPIIVSLLIILMTLVISVVASLLFPEKEKSS